MWSKIKFICKTCWWYTATTTSHLFQSWKVTNTNTINSWFDSSQSTVYFTCTYYINTTSCLTYRQKYTDKSSNIHIKASSSKWEREKQRKTILSWILITLSFFFFSSWQFRFQILHLFVLHVHHHCQLQHILNNVHLVFKFVLQIQHQQLKEHIHHLQQQQINQHVLTIHYQNHLNHYDLLLVQ